MIKLLFHRKFSIQETQHLLINGWEVSGDRNTAWRNNQELTPATYRQQQAKHSEQQTAQQQR
jgi:hypothetical protein